VCTCRAKKLPTLLIICKANVILPQYIYIYILYIILHSTNTQYFLGKQWLAAHIGNKIVSPILDEVLNDSIV
jgi:hypothetical protein